jgi:putative acetyltransferase
MVSIRDYRPGDAAAVREVLTRAFDDHGEVADLAEALTARRDHSSPALVAEADGALLGYVQLSRGWVDAPRRLVDILILSPLGVVPTHQRRGVGRVLGEAARDQARQMQAPAVFLEGNPAYYSRFGWQPASSHGFTAPSVRVPDPGFQVTLLPSWQPWMVGAVVYNDTFWAHDRVGIRDTSPHPTPGRS